VPEEVGEEDLARLRAAGFDQEEIWDIAAVVALFALSNRMALAIDIVPNQEFFMMGRLPRQADPAPPGQAREAQADRPGGAGPAADQKP
jgi:hypothetical protein